MRTAETVQQIAQNQAEHIIDTGVVRAIRGQYLDIVLDGTRKQIREVLLSNTITNIDVGWWVIVTRIPRTNRWIALAALETMGQGTTETLIGQPTPANVTATGKPYLVGLYWEGSFKDTATYEVQHNSSASESGATNTKAEGSNYLYWCAPGTTRHFRVRAVASNFERSAWSDWVNATSDTGEAYMTVGVNAGATAPEWQAFNWGLVAAVTAAGMVHGHTSDAEGGVFPWLGIAVTGVPDQQGAIAMKSVAGTPSVIGGAGIIYPKDVSGLPELHYIDDAGNVVQITSGGGLFGVSDHGDLTGLGDDDHPQYLRVDGTRALTGNLAIDAGITVDGVDISAHAAGDAMTQHANGVGSHTHASAGAQGGEIPLTSLGSYARGSIMRGEGVDWGAHAAETDHFILVGDGTDIVSRAAAWDDLVLGAGADMVHRHQAWLGGGQLRWGDIWVPGQSVHDHGAANEGGLFAPLQFGELSADPDDPAEGEVAMWMSDGTGTGDDGDILMKITANSVTKTVTLVDFGSL